MKGNYVEGYFYDIEVELKENLYEHYFVKWDGSVFVDANDECSIIDIDIDRSSIRVVHKKKSNDIKFFER